MHIIYIYIYIFSGYLANSFQFLKVHLDDQNSNRKGDSCHPNILTHDDVTHLMLCIMAC